MADRIRVEIEQMEELGVQMRKLSSALDALESSIRGVRIERISGSEVRLHLPPIHLGSVGQRVRSGSTAECLSGLASNIGALVQRAAETAVNIGEAADLYRETESGLVGLFSGLSTPQGIFEGICQAIGYSTNISGWTPEMHQKIQQLIQDSQIVSDGDMSLVISGDNVFLIGSSGLIASFEQTATFSNLKSTLKLFDGNERGKAEFEAGMLDGGLSYKDSILKQGDWGTPIKESYDKDGNLIKDHPGFGSITGLISFGAAAGMSYSVWGENASYQGDKLGAELNVGLGNMEVKGSIEGGLGIYKPGKDGKRELYAGITAETGVSVSAANVEASMEYELCDNVSLGAEGEVSVLEAEAGAKGQIGIIGNEFAAYVEASAEANLIEANVEGSLDLGLVEGKVGAGVQVGVGAHASMGYADGVLSFDIGATLGVGVSVNAELDIGGAVDATADFVGDVAEFTGKTVGNAVQTIGKCWSGFWSAVT